MFIFFYGFSLNLIKCAAHKFLREGTNERKKKQKLKEIDDFIIVDDRSIFHIVRHSFTETVNVTYDRGIVCMFASTNCLLLSIFVLMIEH